MNDISKRYKIYVNQFFKRKSYIESKGGIPQTQQPYTIREYTAQYNALKNERVLSGKRPGNINRDLVSEQIYKFTYKQSLTFKNAGINSRLARMGLFQREVDEFFKNVKNRYQELRDSGNDSITAQKIIAREYFGSP